MPREKTRGSNYHLVQALHFSTTASSGRISQLTSQARLDYKRKHLQENSTVAGTARNKEGAHFQEEQDWNSVVRKSKYVTSNRMW